MHERRNTQHQESGAQAKETLHREAPSVIKKKSILLVELQIRQFVMYQITDLIEIIGGVDEIQGLPKA
jgi:hypothetical protein